MIGRLTLFLLLLVITCSCGPSGGPGSGTAVQVPVVPAAQGPRSLITELTPGDISLPIGSGKWLAQSLLPVLSGRSDDATVTLTAAPYRYCWRGTGPGGRSLRYIGRYPMGGAMCDHVVTPEVVQSRISIAVQDVRPMVSLTGCIGPCTVELHLGKGDI